MPETWWEYVTRIADGCSRQDIATAAGVDSSQVSRWSTGQIPRGRHVIQFARTYKRPPVEALIAAQYLDEDEAADIVALTMSVRDLPADALVSEIGSLVAELRRRVPPDQRQDWGEGWVGPDVPAFQQHPAVRRRQG
jgi:transcriptional regulator with XRE-family HTH domain